MGFSIGESSVRFAAMVDEGKARQFRDKPHLRHGILIRWECWPTAKRPQRFLNTRRKWVASVPACLPASSRDRGWTTSRWIERGCHVKRKRKPRLWPAISSRVPLFDLLPASRSIFDFRKEKENLSSRISRLPPPSSSSFRISRERNDRREAILKDSDPRRCFARIRSRRGIFSPSPWRGGEVPLYSLKTAPSAPCLRPLSLRPSPSLYLALSHSLSDFLSSLAFVSVRALISGANFASLPASLNYNRETPRL